MSMDKTITEEARLIILRELASESNGRITSTSIRRHLDEAWGIYREREWVEQQFLWLKEMGAIDLTVAGSVKIASLAEAGRAHLRLRRTIPGVLIPTEAVI